jgi:hypothetical protein
VVVEKAMIVLMKMEHCFENLQVRFIQVDIDITRCIDRSHLDPALFPTPVERRHPLNLSI